MNNIDLKRLVEDREYWDELDAPEAATHANILGGVVFWECNPSSESNSIIPRPPQKAKDVEWVDGLPPVGIVCEMIHPGIENCGWQKVQIKAYFDDRVAIKGSENVWSNSNGYAAIKIDGELRFRPIRTPEQRQRQELAALCKRVFMQQTSSTNPYTFDKIAGAIIADGWSKEHGK